jgi:hypothetical protein
MNEKRREIRSTKARPHLCEQTYQFKKEFQFKNSNFLLYIRIANFKVCYAKNIYLFFDVGISLKIVDSNFVKIAAFRYQTEETFRCLTAA